MQKSRATRIARTRPVAMAAAFLIVSGSTAPAMAQTPAEAELLTAEDALFQADVHRDVSVIERGFADEAIFVHANGMTQTKAQYIEAIRSRDVPIKSVGARNRVVRIFGDVGVVRGTKTLVLGDMHLSGTYLTVYVKRDGRWQMLDEQSSPASQPPQTP